MAARAGRFFGRFFGRTIGDAASFAIGGSISRTIDPVLQQVENEAWQAAVAAGATRPLDAGAAAEIVAENVENVGWGEGQAAQGGIGAEQFGALLGAMLNAPGMGELLRMWRRGSITDADFVHGLRKAKLEARWDGPLEALKGERLDPAVIAVAIQRSIMDDPGFLPVAPPSGAGKVAAFPRSGLDALKEAQAAGIDRERLFVETAIVGNPASPDLAARLTFRQIIDRIDFDRAIAEGNTRNEWADALFEGFRQIPTAHDGIEARLRGWTDDAGMYEQTARHGMSQSDTDLLFKINGRPPSWHQVWIGLARGGVYDGPTDMIAAPFLKSLQESNLRPEWYNLLWHSRYNYPSAFVLRQLTTSGTISEADAEQVLLFEGWEPTFATKVAQAWAGGTPSAASTPTKSFTTAAVKEVSKSYIDGFTAKPEAEANLTRLKVAAADQTALFDIWDITRDVRRKELTVTQIAKAVGVTIDYFTAAQQLLAEGYSAAQVLELLGPAPTDTGQPPVGP